jgi:septin family protein
MKNLNLLLVGLVNSGKTTISNKLCRRGFLGYFSIDDFRKKYSDGSYVGEYRSWYRFLRIASNAPFPKNIFEFSGVGINKEAFMKTIKSSNQTWKTVYCIASEQALKEREGVYDKKLNSVQTPYGKSHFDDITLAEIMNLYESNYYPTPSMLIETDSGPLKSIVEKILKFTKES